LIYPFWLFFLFVDNKTNSVDRQRYNIHDQKNGEYWLGLAQRKHSGPENSAYYGHKANDPKKFFILFHSASLSEKSHKKHNLNGKH